LMSGLFVVQGAQAIANPDRLAGHAASVTERLAPFIARVNPALPTDARTLVRINGAAQVVGGLLLNTAAHRPAAALLAGSMVPTTLAGHPFWTVDDPEQRKLQRIQFMKNLSLIGGLLLAAVDTEGEPGLRWRARHAAAEANKSAHRAARSVRHAAQDASNQAKTAVRAANVGRHLPG
jgi:putative oxidoreductase